MKKIIILLSFLPFIAFGQNIKVCQLPQTSSGTLHDFIVKEDSACDHGTNKMTIADFLSNYGLSFDTTGLSNRLNTKVDSVKILWSYPVDIVTHDTASVDLSLRYYTNGTPHNGGVYSVGYFTWDQIKDTIAVHAGGIQWSDTLSRKVDTKFARDSAIAANYNCNSYNYKASATPYTWNSVTYSVSGQYRHQFTGGCHTGSDSTAYLFLDIDPSGADTTNFWSINGNAGTNSAVHFIGTTDTVGLNIKTNNDTAIYIDAAGNTQVGTDTRPAALINNGGFSTENEFLDGINYGYLISGLSGGGVTQIAALDSNSANNITLNVGPANSDGIGYFVQSQSTNTQQKFLQQYTDKFWGYPRYLDQIYCKFNQFGIETSLDSSGWYFGAGWTGNPRDSANFILTADRKIKVTSLPDGSASDSVLVWDANDSTVKKVVQEPSGINDSTVNAKIDSAASNYLLLAGGTMNNAAHIYFGSGGQNISQGSFDNGTGGDGGISLNCAIGYELNWQGGHLSNSTNSGVTQLPLLVDNGINTLGNVGIGTVTPNATLDVNGDINFNDVVKYRDFTILKIDTNKRNYFLGIGVGNSTTGINNLFIGDSCGYSNTTGLGNTFSGWKSGYSNTTGILNTFYGILSGYSNTSGSYNTFSGWDCGFTNTSGFKNTFIGVEAEYYNTTGINITAIGYRAGIDMSDSADCSGNIYIGHDADSTTLGIYQNGKTGIIKSNGRQLSFEDEVVWKDSSGSIFPKNIDSNVGIGTDIPVGKLTVIGHSYISDNSTAFPTSDAFFSIWSTIYDTITPLVSVSPLNANPTLYISNGSNSNIGIGTASPDNSSLIDMESTNKGLLPPRMTTTDILAISSPAEGLMVYDIVLHKLYVWDGTIWQAAW